MPVITRKWIFAIYSWVHAPPCDSCGNQTVSQGMGVPLPAELQYGGSRVELYWYDMGHAYLFYQIFWFCLF